MTVKGGIARWEHADRTWIHSSPDTIPIFITYAQSAGSINKMARSRASDTAKTHRPQMSNAGLDPTQPVEARDEFGDSRSLHVAGEYPLTIKVDERELVTLMTLGTYPET